MRILIACAAASDANDITATNAAAAKNVWRSLLMALSFRDGRIETSLKRAPKAREPIDAWVRLA
jgi:hypothetical protein